MLTLLPLMRSPGVRPKARVSSAHVNQAGRAQCGGLESRAHSNTTDQRWDGHKRPSKAPHVREYLPNFTCTRRYKNVLISVNKVQLSGLPTASRMSCWPTTPPSSTCQNRAGALGATSRLWADPRGVVYLCTEQEREKEWRSADRHPLRSQPAPMHNPAPSDVLSHLRSS
jgi:hypothetical protein